jgi:hypothetical protein
MMVRHPQYGVIYSSDDGFVCPGLSAKRWANRPRQEGERMEGEELELCESLRGRYYLHFRDWVAFVTHDEAARWLLEHGYYLPEELQEVGESLIE